MSPIERAALGLARLIAGPERRSWLDAMEAELHWLDYGRIDWALGSLVAATKDRFAREKLTLAALAVVPACAAAAVVPVTALAAIVFRTTGLSMDLLGPALLPIPFACAALLGAARHWRHPMLAGMMAFAVYQAGPSGFMSLAWGSSFGFWSPNLAHYGIHPAVSLVGTFGLWSLGMLLGARIGKRRHGEKVRSRLSPPSP